MDKVTEEKAVKFLNEFAGLIEGAEIDGNNLIVTRDGITMNDVLDIVEVKTGSEWHRKGTGKLAFSVKDGYYVTVKTYRERKDGSYNLQLIDELNHQIGWYIRKYKAQNIRFNSQQVVKQALLERGIEHSRSLRPTQLSIKAKVDVSITIELEDLDKMIAFMKELGIE